MLRACLLVLVGCGRVGFEIVDTTDASASPDVGVGGWVPCAPAGPGSVALYTFDEPDLGAEATGVHLASARPPLSVVPGACGNGVALGTDGHLLVPDAPAFDLPTGSIELYMRTSVQATGSERSFFGRDALGLMLPGHLQAGITAGGDMIARLQDGEDYFRCAPPRPLDTWVHVGISFGGLPSQGFRMWIDHVEATQATSTFGGASATCGLPVATGIAGNDNTLILGANNGAGADGAVEPSLHEYFRNGQLDHIHLRDRWVDFGAR